MQRPAAVSATRLPCCARSSKASARRRRSPETSSRISRRGWSSWWASPGGLPSDDVTLGAVVLSTRIHDFTVEARKAGHKAAYAATGGPIDKAIANAVAGLANREDALGNWTADLPARPRVAW